MDAISKSERELLKAIHRLSHVAGTPASPPVGASAEVHTGDLAGRLGLSPSTVTTAIKRLADRGLLDHRPYRGVELTERGSRVAVASIRRHRIVERFLADQLGYDDRVVDELAASFEHELPQDVEDRLFEALGRPTTCPHGHPIPAAEGAERPPMAAAGA